MPYKISDKIFYLKIDEQVEYLTNIINDEIDPDIESIKVQLDDIKKNKQDKADEELQTDVKTIVGAINELLAKHQSLETKVNENDVSSKQRDDAIKITFDEYKTSTDSILQTHSTLINKNKEDIAKETTRATVKEDELQSNITAEESRAIDSEEDLQEKITNNDTKISNLHAAISEIYNDIEQVRESITDNTVAISNVRYSVNDKQDITSNDLKTESKWVIGAINEVNNKVSQLEPKIAHIYKHDVYFNIDPYCRVNFNILTSSNVPITDVNSLIQANNNVRRIPGYITYNSGVIISENSTYPTHLKYYTFVGDSISSNNFLTVGYFGTTLLEYYGVDGSVQPIHVIGDKYISEREQVILKLTDIDLSTKTFIDVVTDIVAEMK